MPTPGTFEALSSAKTIGAANLAAWGSNFATSDYLDVLPHPNQSLRLDSGWNQWQRGNRRHRRGLYSEQSENGSYHSSWGPSKELNVTLKMSSLDQQTIAGLGRVKANQEGGRFNSVYDTSFWNYNKQIGGPLLVANPGDRIKIKLINDLEVEEQILAGNPHAYKTNLHGHGLHVSPSDNSDNVLLTLQPGETWRVEWKLPKDHMSGLNWAHPHYHGSSSLSIAKGLALPLVILPTSSEGANAYDPTREDVFLLNLQSWALAQQERPASANDPLNQDPSGTAWPIGTPPQRHRDAEGDYFKASPARFNGNNYYPVDRYNPAKPSSYGDGVGLMPNENVIHSVNGSYNPTLETETGQWATFLFENFSLNSTHIIQLIRRDDNGKLSVEATNILGTDSDLSHWVAPETIEQLPLLMPGGRVGIQHAFTKPGEYYFISNASKEVLGDLAPTLSNVPQSSSSTYLGYHDGFQVTPSQVLATVQVRGAELETAPPQPRPWRSLRPQYERSQALRERVSQRGVDVERQFDWLTSTPKGKEFNNPETWENTWTINGQYWSHAPNEQPTLTTTMLDTVERWRVRNLSAGRVTTNLSGDQSYNVVGQSHPFHIHTNEFLIEAINGLQVSADPALNQVGDSFFSTYLDNLLLGPRYSKGSATAGNAYGTPGFAGSADEPFQADLLLEFKDFPGIFMDHCHFLFHEDAGMMVAVQTILNTEASWLVSDADPGEGTIRFSLAADLDQALELRPYGNAGGAGQGGINVSMGDVNANRATFQPGRNGATVNVTDNIADVATLQTSLRSPSERFQLQIYDGAALLRSWKQGQPTISGEPLWTIQPFSGRRTPASARTDLAIGDINGDGYGDLVASLGGKGMEGAIEIYSGRNQKLLAVLRPFADAPGGTAINLAVGDVNADGFADILAAQGEGGQGRVEAFDGIALYRLLQEADGDPLTGLRVSRETALLDGLFQPYGPAYSGAVDVVASYALPRGFDPNQVHQTPSANITTLRVGSGGGASDPSIRNFLFVGDEHGSGDHMTGCEGEPHCHHHPSGLAATIPGRVMYTSGYGTATAYTQLEAQYVDLPNGLRGQATLLATTASGRKDLLYLPDSLLQSGDLHTFESTTFGWSPAPLG